MAAEAHLDVTVVTVAFNSTAVLPTMLASVPSDIRVIIVDNGSSDIAELQVLAQRENTELVLNEINRGFGIACNQGAQRATTEFLLFLNPDATLEQGALEGLVAAARAYPHASAFNPRIASSSGKPVFRRSSHLVPKSSRMPRGWPAADTEVSILSGAALFVRKAAFDQIGGFDPEIFLYHEDDDIARRLNDECGPIMFVREPLVRHLGGHSSSRSAEIAALKGWHMGRSRAYTTQKHERPFAFAVSLGSAILQLLSPLVVLSRRKRAKQWAFLKGVLSTYRHSVNLNHK